MFDNPKPQLPYDEWKFFGTNQSYLKKRRLQRWRHNYCKKKDSLSGRVMNKLKNKTWPNLIDYTK